MYFEGYCLNNGFPNSSYLGMIECVEILELNFERFISTTYLDSVEEIIVNGTTISKESFEFIVDCFKKEQLSIQVDSPFKGGNIIHEISKQSNIEAIQIEIPYSMYLCEKKLDKNKLENIQEKLLNVFLKMEEFYTNF